jgi:archaellum component FlaD/FlaE
MIKELLDGVKSRLKIMGEKGPEVPPAGMPPSPDQMPPSDDSESNPVPESAPSTEDFSALLGGGDTSELEEKVKELDDKTNKLDSTIRETLEITKDNKTRLDSIDNNMKKFISLYEIVTNQINPFVDSEDAKPESKPGMMDELKVKEEPKEKEKLTLPEEEPPEPEEETPAPKIQVKPETEKQAVKPESPEKVMFLQSVKDGNASFVLEWITSLVSDDGNIEQNTKLLKYLIDLGWITPKAYEALMGHMQALAQANKKQDLRKAMPMTVGVSHDVALPQYGNMGGSERRIPEPALKLPFGTDNAAYDDRDNLMAVLEWLKSLIDNVGYDQAMDVLKHLVKLEWITPDAHRALIQYINQDTGSQYSDAREYLSPKARVELSPKSIPTPQDFMRMEGVAPQPPAQNRQQYQIPIQPSNQFPIRLESRGQEKHPQSFKSLLEDSRERSSGRGQTAKRQDKSDSIIPLTELGNDIESLAIILEWIRYLVDRAGTAGAKEVFSYYQNIGWLNQRVSQQLNKYVDGIKSDDDEVTDFKPTIEDHATSLFFISKLKHMELSEDQIQEMLGQ